MSGNLVVVNSKRINKATLHKRLPFWLHGYIWPFLLLYPGWLYAYNFQYEDWIVKEEITIVTTIALGTIHLLTFLVGQWSNRAYAFLTCISVSALKDAEQILLIPSDKQGKAALVNLDKHSTETSFNWLQKKFVYNDKSKEFEKLTYPNNLSFGKVQQYRGLTEKEVQEQMTKYGLNRFDIPVPTFSALFKQHAVAPFFVFQLFCISLWCLDEYWYYSIFTLFMLVTFESTVVFQRLRTLTEFRSLSFQPFSVYVFRKGEWTSTTSESLLPGDILSVVRSNDETAVPCDLILQAGSCIVNEAMLSGESTPQSKESVFHREAASIISPDDDKQHWLFGGTKVLQVTAPSSEESPLPPPPDGGCLAYVVRTGFGTTQGKLVRTMVYHSEHVSVNNAEAFLFIFFLFLFAVVAAHYVWTEGSKNEQRKKSKLILDCVMILTSVVPPELPMELSLAVNTSLVALSKFAIFCTEPFRIPLAGKIDICCFDKTGTLTGENLVVEGVAGLPNDPQRLIPPNQVPLSTALVLASAHGLVNLEQQQQQQQGGGKSDSLVGDPMEKATLTALQGSIDKDDMVTFVKGASGSRKIKIRRRYPFSSALKRMSTVCSIMGGGGELWVSAKGAPEVIAQLCAKVPADYEKTYKYFSSRGQRVLALAHKTLPSMNAQQIHQLGRDKVESELNFAGFLIFHCPLKPDSRESIQMLNQSNHRVVMITGDNPLTACHVAREVEIINKPCLVLDVGEEKLRWKSVDDRVILPFGESTDGYDLCLTGQAMGLLSTSELLPLLSKVWVYARVSPSQKETILISLKQLGYITLMCGDGTNDVGALKQAHVGVALLDGTPEDLEKIAAKQRLDRLKHVYENQLQLSARFKVPPPPPPPAIAHLYPAVATAATGNNANNAAAASRASSQMAERMLGELGADEDVPVLKFGDASVAAPFTSKLSSVNSVCHVIRQGRCTLVATIQMYKILALNCLISAYSLSVLFLDGIKYGDFQVTISGMLMAVCFLMISKATPIEKLSPMRPQTNIFNPYIITSVLGQFAVHLSCLIFVVSSAKASEPLPRNYVDLDGVFSPTLLNTAVYLISLSMQVSTFAVNYQGEPFRESLRQNKVLFNGLRIVAGIALAGATEILPTMNEFLQLVPLPATFRTSLTMAIVLDFVMAYLVERAAYYCFANNKPKPIANHVEF